MSPTSSAAQPTATTGTPYRVPLVAFLVANVVSICGTRVSAIAIPWFVLVSTGSPVKMGLVAAAETLPLVISKAFGGPLIDRLGGRLVSVGADSCSAVVVGLIPLLHLLGALPFRTLLILVAIAGALRGPGDAAKGTLIPDIADAANAPLERVTGLESTTERFAGFIAFLLAGGLISLVGAANALWIDAASFAICAVLIAWWVPRRSTAVAAAQADQEDQGSYLQQLRTGWRFLSRDKLLRPLVLMISVTNLLDAASFAVLLPLWVHEHGHGPAQTTLVLTVFSVTATLFALLAASIGERIPRRLAFTLSFLVCGAPRFIVLALDLPLWVILLAFATSGVGAGFINPILGALFIERIPRHMLGRVDSLAGALGWAGIPLGGVLAGATVAGIGLAPALVIAGILYFVATLSPVLMGRAENWGGHGSTAPRQDLPDPQERADCQDLVAVPASSAS
jgi:MFS family permease